MITTTAPAKRITAKAKTADMTGEWRQKTKIYRMRRLHRRRSRLSVDVVLTTVLRRRTPKRQPVVSYRYRQMNACIDSSFAGCQPQQPNVRTTSRFAVDASSAEDALRFVSRGGTRQPTHPKTVLSSESDVGQVSVAYTQAARAARQAKAIRHAQGRDQVDRICRPARSGRAILPVHEQHQRGSDPTRAATNLADPLPCSTSFTSSTRRLSTPLPKKPSTATPTSPQ